MSRFYFVFTALFLSACSSDVFLVHNGNMPSDDKISMVQTGQTKEEVADILGSPSAVSSINENEWIYMSSTLKKVAFFEPKILERDVLTIRFGKNGKVQEISKLDEKNGKNISVDEEETASEGHNPGFFKKYFGGVGQYMPIGPSKEK
ncbi:MAG: outer membrane protein assembly factor BamE [Alphaproteobacteria bacterium]|nr:outer membrane protein assembly factor BamE [Alphaproteobacteria bacterium]